MASGYFDCFIDFKDELTSDKTVDDKITFIDTREKLPHYNGVVIITGLSL